MRTTASPRRSPSARGTTPRRSVSRRRFLGGALGATALLAAPACASSGGTGPAGGQPGAHRVVAIGQGADADALIALGVPPVGMSTGYQIDVYPWTAGALGGRPVELLPTTAGVPIERVAALRPTLIAATTYYQLDPVRAELEKIAPVIGPSSQVDKETWQQSTVRVGEAVGRADEARRIVADVERVVADARAAHPQWQGRTFTFGPVIPGQDLYTVNSTSDASAALLSALGLRLAPAVTRLPNAGLPGRAKLSQEQMGLFDADALLLAHFGGDAARAEFEKQGVFRSIPAVRRGSYVPLDPALAIALAFPSVLNIPYAVREIAPLLDRALA